MLLLYIVLLIGYGALIVLYYQEKKYKTAAIWALIFVCVFYIMIEVYNAGYLIQAVVKIKPLQIQYPYKFKKASSLFWACF